MQAAGGTSAALLGITAVVLSGCYAGTRATRDVNRAWEGRAQGELVARWGEPTRRVGDGDGLVAVWAHARDRVAELPSGAAGLRVDEAGLDAFVELRPGSMTRHWTHVVARIDGAGVIESVAGPSLRWGPPNEANLHWGTLLGAHVGMGRLDDTGTPLPSGGLYLGGMLSRTVGLVGTFSLASGRDDAGGAMGLAWGIAPQWWPATRLSLRAGPALVLAFDPGFADAGLEPGLDLSASYAVVKVGTLAVDLRLGLVAGTSTRFGSVGVGVNLN